MNPWNDTPCNCPKCQPEAPPRQRVFAFLGYNYAIQGIFESISVSGDPVKGILYPDGYLEWDDTGEGLMPTYGSTVFYGPY